MDPSIAFEGANMVLTAGRWVYRVAAGAPDAPVQRARHMLQAEAQRDANQAKRNDDYAALAPIARDLHQFLVDLEQDGRPLRPGKSARRLGIDRAALQELLDLLLTTKFVVRTGSGRWDYRPVPVELPTPVFRRARP